MHLPVLGGASAVIVVFWLTVAALDHFIPKCAEDFLTLRLIAPFQNFTADGVAYTKRAPSLTSTADSGQRPAQSPYLVCENGYPLGPAHSLHAEIASKGQGRFSHWAPIGFIFSASDNSDPNSNGRTYTATRPCDDAELGGLCGSWRGAVAHQDAPVTYPVEMQLYGAGGNTTYPVANCGGRLEFLHTDGAGYWYREHITYGADKCGDGGIIGMRADPSGETSWSWTWTGPGGSVAGVLRDVGLRRRR
jgi:hypothetical protein